MKEAARQISDLSSEDFSLIRSVSLSESGNQPFPVTDGGNVSSQLSSLLDKFRPDLLCDSGTASDMEAADTVKAGEDDGCEQTAVVDLDVSTGLSLGVSSFEPCPPSITALDAQHTTLPDVEAAMSATATSPEHKQTDTGQNDAEQTEIATDAETSSSTEHTAAPDISVEHTTASDISVEHTTVPDISIEHTTAPDISVEHTIAPDISAEHSTATDINAEHSDINAEHSTATDINAEHTTAADVNAEHTTVIDSATLSTCADDTPVEQALDVNVEHTSTALTTPPDIEPATTATDDVRAATVPEGQHTTSPNTAPEASAKNTTNSTPDVEPIIAEQELVVETKRRKESPSPAKSLNHPVVSLGNHRKRNYASRKQKRLEERIKSERTCTVPGPTEHEQKLQTRDQEAEEVQFNHEEVVQFLWQGKLTIPLRYFTSSFNHQAGWMHLRKQSSSHSMHADFDLAKKKKKFPCSARARVRIRGRGSLLIKRTWEILKP